MTLLSEPLDYVKYKIITVPIERITLMIKRLDFYIKKYDKKCSRIDGQVCCYKNKVRNSKRINC